MDIGDLPELHILGAKYGEYRSQYRQSEGFVELKELFEHDILKQESVEIEQCICVALGSPSSRYRDAVKDGAPPDTDAWREHTDPFKQLIFSSSASNTSVS